MRHQPLRVTGTSYSAGGSPSSTSTGSQPHTGSTATRGGYSTQVTAWLLAESGINPIDLVTLHRKYSRETGNESHVSCIVSVPPFRKAEVIIADGDGAPVIASGIPVGSGAIPSLLFGNVLIIKVHIPATLLVAAAGRPLGDLAATGILMLDERRIEHAHSTDDCATLTLEADLTTIGEARRAMGRA